MWRVILTIMAGLALMILGCETNQQLEIDKNPAAEGFNLEKSDSLAIAIADSVMLAMGGRSAWDKTEVIKWNFFGRRTLEWNKNQNKVKINLLADSILIDLDMSTNEGEVYFKDQLQTHPDTLSKFLERGKNIWINDSYWLVMPFKLKDSGVTLKYLGNDTTSTGEASHLMSLTFENVGVTPQNKYDILVSKNDHLVKEWRFYTQATDTVPRFITPWQDYQQYGMILLSGNRGRSTLSDISVSNSNLKSLE